MSELTTELKSLHELWLWAQNSMWGAPLGLIEISGYLKHGDGGQARWHTRDLRLRLRQEDQEFETRLGYRAKFCFTSPTKREREPYSIYPV